MDARYETIGIGYARTRREDPVLLHSIQRALEGATSVVNVGAGAGSYEPRGPAVIAVEPSLAMIAQRGGRPGGVVRASAGHLPLRSQCVDAAMTVLSVHHWDDEQERGVRELRRVARGPVVIVTIDPEVSGSMWLLAEYLPEVAELDQMRGCAW